MTTRLVFLTSFGSHLYGTNRRESDVDYRAVFLPSAEDILCQTVPDVLRTPPPELADTDYMATPFHRFLKLVRFGEPSFLDMAFAPEEFWVKSHTDEQLWEWFLANRGELLSSDLPKYFGFCKTMVEVYGTQTARQETARQALAMVETAVVSYGGQAKVSTVVDQLKTLDDHFTKFKPDANGTDMVSICGTAIQVTESLAALHGRLVSRNKQIAYRMTLKKTTDTKDFKALHHAVRIVEQGLELLQTGKLVFPRPNAEYLLAIKQEATDYEATVHHLETTYQKMLAARETSVLPESVDDSVIRRLTVDIYQRALCS